MECPKPANPFVLLILQSLAFSTPATHSTNMTSILKSCFRCVNEVNDGPSEVPHIPFVHVFWATLHKVFVQTCVTFIPAQACTFCGAPSATNISCTTHIQQLAMGVMDQVDKPFQFLFLTSRQMHIPSMDCKPSFEVVRGYT